MSGEAQQSVGRKSGSYGTAGDVGGMSSSSGMGTAEGNGTFGAGAVGSGYSAGYAANSASDAGTAGVSLRPGSSNGYSPYSYGTQGVLSTATVVDSQIARSSYRSDTDSAYAMAGYAYNAGTTTFASKDAYTTKTVTGVMPMAYSAPQQISSRATDAGQQALMVRKQKMEYEIEEVEVPRTIQVPREVIEEVMVPKQVPRTIVEEIMVPKQVPRTVYDTVMVPQEVTRTVMETVMVPEQRTRTIMEDKIVIETQQYRVAKPAMVKKKVMMTRPKMVTEEVEVDEALYEEEEVITTDRGFAVNYGSHSEGAATTYQSRDLANDASGAKMYSSVGYQQGGYLTSYGSTRGSIYSSSGVAYAHGGEYVTPRSSYNYGGSPTAPGNISPSNDINNMMAKLRADYK